MTVREWIREADDKLRDAGVESSRLEAGVLAAHALGSDRAWVLAHPETLVDFKNLDELLARRLKREPLAYILGYRDFYGRKFRVDPRVLIPRQETETLVEAVLGLIPDRPGLRILDLGTGSGCIAITLALERSNWEAWGSDISGGALAVARENALALGAIVKWVQSSCFEHLQDEQFDAIITNPPYVSERARLQPEVRDWEPHEALFASNDGLGFFADLAESSSKHLKGGGLLFVEVGDAQADATQSIFIGKGWQRAGIWRDLSAHERVIAWRTETRPTIG